MHKRIVDAIIKALSQREDTDKYFHFFVDDKETGGFWRLCVIVNPEYKHMLPHIQSIGRAIGSFYGEGLGIEVKWNTIIFS